MAARPKAGVRDLGGRRGYLEAVDEIKGPLPDELLHNAEVALAAWQVRRPGSEELGGDALAQALGAILAWHQLERVQP